MRKALCVIGGFIFLAAVLPAAAVPRRQPKTELQRMKMAHKAERRLLKAQQKAWKRSFRGQPIPRADRIREKHQMQRDMRNMKQRQKDQIQDYKDQKRMLKQSGRSR